MSSSGADLQRTTVTQVRLNVKGFIERGVSGEETVGLNKTYGALHARVERPTPCTRSLGPDSTLVAVLEMSEASWLVAAIVPGMSVGR